jgi:glycosyltransferase involved in cell wall biosynthesis
MRLEAVKGPDVFLRAARLIAEEIPEARFVVVGDGSMRGRLEADAAALGLRSRIQFMGERDDVADILPTFSVFCLPSRLEGMSMALLEAMAAGRPIVATRVGGTLDLIRDGETGLLVPTEDPETMARAALRFLRDPWWAEQCGEAGRSMVMQHYSADSMVRRIEAIYAGLLQFKMANRLPETLQTRESGIIH